MPKDLFIFSINTSLYGIWKYLKTGLWRSSLIMDLHYGIECYLTSADENYTCEVRSRSMTEQQYWLPTSNCTKYLREVSVLKLQYIEHVYVYYFKLLANINNFNILCKASNGFFFKYENMINDIYQFFTFIFTRRPKSRFLPRDAMRKRGFAVARCLSVRLSVTFVYCIQTAEDIVKLLSRPGSPIILVFWPRAPGGHRYQVPRESL